MKDIERVICKKFRRILDIKHFLVNEFRTSKNKYKNRNMT